MRKLSVHVVVGADVDECNAVGCQDEHDAVLGVLGNRHDGGFDGG